VQPGDRPAAQLGPVRFERLLDVSDQAHGRTIIERRT
jgi:hypothetical protein